MGRMIAGGALGALVLWLAGCTSSQFGALELQGSPGLVQDESQATLWVLQKIEETRQVGVGSGRRGSALAWREDTFFHFEVTGFDAATLEPKWGHRLVTYGDPTVRPNQVGPSRVVGSAVSARLLGQDGDRVWLLVDAQPFVLDAHDGRLLHDRAGLVAAQPALADLLPDDPRLWRFDRGPVLTLADGRVVRLAGAAMVPEAYVPSPAPAAPAPTWSSGRPRIVPTPPMRPLLRHVARGDDEWLALLTEREAEDARGDDRGEHVLFPYTIVDDGPLARRRFHRVRLEETTWFDDRFPHIAAVEPIDDAPVLLRGRFVRDPRTGAAFSPGDDDVLAWHLDRIDAAGRLQLSRFDRSLRPRWQASLPMGDASGFPALFWPVGDRLLVVGWLEREALEVRTRTPFAASVSLADGRFVARSLGDRDASPDGDG